MAIQVQNRRGTTTQHNTFTGAVGEITVDTTKDTAVVHDGTTTGGHPLLREDLTNLPASGIPLSKLSADVGRVFVQPTAPTAGQLNGATTYVWWDTSGGNLTLWVEDGQ